MTDSERDAQCHLISLAFQYHVAGRCAARCQLISVTGNLLHHAIEVLLKALIVRDVGLRGVASFGHKLVPLWAAVVQKYPELNSLDRTGAVESLDRFELLRYPDDIVAKGAAVRFGWERAPAMPTMKVPAYDLAMEDVDELFRAAFGASGLNPEFFLVMLSQEARIALRDRNRHTLGAIASDQQTSGLTSG